uniref:Glutamine--fructose-6-phosphate aminotransferase [isomerizing] n=1 Tax=Helicotheca tamesis TaxID=374047 RepID=A0A7S2MLC9_9STRA|eukprot:CAMPEP_0185732130 /NCGR_PEP_ID=MMETSP1171-20130828/15118_1 /TAXON_ID=374046 /ORGANISM="Helicotheca tamensis, Strain CCMP826" /LENGTH=728 /DNA_ID=CAMNT_0028401541 /DNA_START=173 /DNA_END=2359 /DNA_ORIENTATION=-
MRSSASSFISRQVLNHNRIRATNSTASRNLLKKNNLLSQRLHTKTPAAAAACIVPSASVLGNDGSSSSSRGKMFNQCLAAVAGATTLLSAGIMSQDNTTDCCGIAGVVGTKGHDARDFLIEGLTVLKNRGYDSAGLATMPENGGKMFVTKYASDGDKADSIGLVRDRSSMSASHHIGIAHTRWATHGGKTDENAHPHVDSSGKIALVHNGTLNNANELRRELVALGHKFTSQTDTEVIAKLIGHYRDEEPTLSVRDATEKALNRCDGTWGLCIMCTDEPDELVVACNGSPLVIGISDDRTFIASETSAFNRYTKNFISMKDGEIGILHADGRTLDLSRKQRAPDQEVKLSPDPYPHWTLKECVEQPEAIARALGFGGRLSSDQILLGGLDANYDTLKKIKYMTLSACGTSLNAAKYAERLMKHLGSFESVTSIDAAETEAKDFPNCQDPKETGLIVVSQSGETKDVHRVVLTAMERDISVMSVVNSVGSLIARTTKLGVYCNAGRENAVASTKAFTTQITVLALIALWFRQTRDKMQGLKRPSIEATRLKEALMRLPISFGMTMKTREQCLEIAKRLREKEHCFVLGKGYGEPVAMEGALKIKEMCYLHAEGYSGGALKHGPFALIEDDKGMFGATPIVLIILDDNHAAHMRTAAEEVKARGADLIIITDKPSLAADLDDNPIIIPSNGPMTALGAVLPLQLIAYELAMMRGINPDTPRNLAKAVTVD